MHIRIHIHIHIYTYMIYIFIYIAILSRALKRKCHFGKMFVSLSFWQFHFHFDSFRCNQWWNFVKMTIFPLYLDLVSRWAHYIVFQLESSIFRTHTMSVWRGDQSFIPGTYIENPAQIVVSMSQAIHIYINRITDFETAKIPAMRPGRRLNRCHLTSIWSPMLKIRRSRDRLIFNMESSYLERPS